MALLFIDFPILPDIPSKWAWTFSGILYAFILAFFNKYAIYDNVSISVNKKRVFVALVCIYCICAVYCGDWAHLQTILKEILGSEYIAGAGVEKVYWYLNNILDANYLLFRTIVWGGGLYCLLNSFKYAHVNHYKCLYFLFGIYITAFAYSRAGVALAIFYFGFVLAFHFKEHKTLWTIMIGIGLIVASTFFHRSVLALAVFAPLALIPVKKSNIFLILLIVVVIGYAWNNILSSVVGAVMENDEYAHRMEFYGTITGSIVITFDLNGLFTLWYKAIVHVPFWICIVSIYKKRDQGIIPSTIQYVFNFSIILYIFCIMMLMTYGSASALYYRYEGMLYIPISIMVCYLYQNKLMSYKTYNTLFWFCSMTWVKDFIYRIFFM